MDVHDLPTTPQSLLCLLIMCTLLATTTSSCPPDALQQAKACTVILGLQPGPGSPREFIKEGDGEKALHACSNGDLLDAINCQERILERCKHDNSDDAHFLRRMVNIEKGRQAVTFFCTNIRVFVNNAACIADHHQEQQTCAMDAYNTFMTQVKATTNRDALIRFQCRVYFESVRCTEKVLTDKCSSDVADVVKTIMLGFQPPACDEFRSTGQTSRKVGTSYDIDKGSSGVTDNNDENSAYVYGAHMLTFLVCLFLTLLT